ncbi:TPA: MFS transporter [Burkholderia orbicola]|uniref:MFS transporter n=1 Tax=Burkholderia cenocepacia TaxID=95486 RepID=UPI000F59A821|nr:MFS transporter [Burkholderia cenocepacia]MBR8111089.1 MFS transporter [Burkholderia cenocepacia]RQV16791.1 MFS transporter [Burkholderia cenocepacia]
MKSELVLEKRASSSLAQLYVWLSFKTISDISSTMISIVLATYALEVTGSAALLGLTMASRLLGAVAGGAAVPRLSRFSRRTLIFAAEAGSALAIGVLAMSSRAADASLIYFVPFFIGLFQGIYRVSIMSEVPEMVGQEGRHRFNAILSATDGVSVVGGSLLASVITQYLAYKSVFLIDSITFAISAIAFLMLVGNMPRRHRPAEETHAAAEAGALPRAARYLSVIVMLVICARFVEAFGSGTHNVGFPIRSQLFDPNQPAFLYGWLMAVWGVGRLVSAAVTPRLLERLESRHQPLEPYFIALLILTFACFLGVFEVRGMPGMLGFVLLAGIFDAATETIYYSLLQSTPAASRDRVIGISYVAERTGLGLGMLTVGFVFSRLGTDVTALLFYGGSIALAGLAFVGVKRRLAQGAAIGQID